MTFQLSNILSKTGKPWLKHVKITIIFKYKQDNKDICLPWICSDMYIYMVDPDLWVIDMVASEFLAITKYPFNSNE